MHIKDFNVLFVLGGVHAGMGRLINIRHHPLLLERAFKFNLICVFCALNYLNALNLICSLDLIQLPAFKRPLFGAQTLQILKKGVAIKDF